jgi:hypothetical protein
LLGRGLAASSLAAAFLFVNACEPTDSTIGSQDAPVAGGECDNPGETRSLGDGCNDCTCGTDKRWLCTALTCDGGTVGASGSAGTAGASGSGGSAGSAGSGGSAGSAGSGGSGGTGGCSHECAIGEVNWRNDGGFVAYHLSSKLESCTDYTLTKTPVEVARPEQQCSVKLECTEQAVQQALSRSDVAEAFDSGILYGRDTRPVDGVVLIVTHQGKSLSVGDECRDGDPPNCIPLPVGVRALVAALRDLDQRMLMRQECAGLLRP